MLQPRFIWLPAHVDRLRALATEAEHAACDSVDSIMVVRCLSHGRLFCAANQLCSLGDC